MKKQDLINLTKKTHKASRTLSNFSSDDKNKLLKLIHVNIYKNRNNILKNNKIDIRNSKDMNKDFAFIDRLTLTEHKIELMLNGIENIISLNDPVGKIIEDKILDNEMNLKKITVPLGVIGVIYESRPDITTDISSLCIKSGNAVILKGGKESINTNLCLTSIIKQSLKEFGTDDNFVNLIESTDRKITKEFLQLNEYIDLMIPRGGKSLVKMVEKEAKMPSITGGIGVTHIYIDPSADIYKAIPVVLNSKVSKPSVCNALDTLLINSKILPTFLPLMIKSLSESNVEIRCDTKSYNEIKKYNYRNLNYFKDREKKLNDKTIQILKTTKILLKKNEKNLCEKILNNFSTTELRNGLKVVLTLSKSMETHIRQTKDFRKNIKPRSFDQIW